MKQKEKNITRSWFEKAVTGESLMRLADYDKFRHEVEIAAMGNPYPFKEWFTDGDRAYITLNSDSPTELSNDDNEIISILEENGYQTTPEDYVSGYTVGRSGKRFRIGKILDKVIEVSLERELDHIYRSTVDMMENGYDAEMARQSIKEREESIRGYYEDVKRNFMNSSSRTGSGNRLLVVISQNPHDIASMSTDRGWTSCTDLEHGSNRDTVFCEVAHGSLVAYVIRPNDKDIENPLARIHIKRFVNKAGDSYAIPERVSYGAEVDGFYETVSRWINERQGSMPVGLYRRVGGHYSDTLDKDIFHLPDDKQELEKIALNGVEDGDQFVVWRVTLEYGLEDFFIPEDDYGYGYGDDQFGYDGLSKDFDTVEEAKNFIDGLYYDDDWRDEIGEDMPEWLETDDDGNWVEQPFHITKVNLKNQHEIRGEAAKKLIDEYGIEAASDEVIMIRKKYHAESKAFNREIFFAGRGHLLTEDEKSNMVADENYLPALANEILEEKDQSERSRMTNEYNSLVVENLDYIIEAPEEAARSSYNPSVVGRQVNLRAFYEKTISGLTKLYSSRNPIPHQIVMKMIELCNEMVKSTSPVIVGDQEYRNFPDKIRGITIDTLRKTEADTPPVISWYKSMVADWRPEWEIMRENGGVYSSYGQISVFNLGYGIGSLGKDNGSEFIPFIRKRMEEAAEFYRNLEDETEKNYVKMCYDAYSVVLNTISGKTF